MIIGKSRPRTAVIASWPIPGQAKIVSMMTVPPSRPGSASAMTVMSGMSALRAAWPKHHHPLRAAPWPAPR